MPDGTIITRLVATNQTGTKRRSLLRDIERTTGIKQHEDGAASMKPFIDAGARPLEGHQLRYIYFLDPAYRERLTVPEIPFSRIWEMGAGMYRGEKVAQQRAGEATGVAAGDQPVKGGSIPTRSLLTPELASG